MRARMERAAGDFGAEIRRRRRAQRLRQEDLSLATGVGRRFIIDLEAGKTTSQLGPALLVAAALGMTVGSGATDADMPMPDPDRDGPDLPDLE